MATTVQMPSRVCTCMSVVCWFVYGGTDVARCAQRAQDQTKYSRAGRRQRLATHVQQRRGHVHRVPAASRKVGRQPALSLLRRRGHRIRARSHRTMASSGSMRGTEVDKLNRTVTLDQVQLTKVNFPAEPGKNAELTKLLETKLPNGDQDRLARSTASPLRKRTLRRSRPSR